MHILHFRRFRELSPGDVRKVICKLPRSECTTCADAPEIGVHRVRWGVPSVRVAPRALMHPRSVCNVCTFSS